MNLTYDQKTEIGFTYILNRLAPSSPYGQELVRHMEPWPVSDREGLIRELDRLEALLAKKEALRQPLGRLKRIFMMMKTKSWPKTVRTSTAKSSMNALTAAP